MGKTFLLGHFAAARRGLFFGATQQAEPVELQRLHDAVVRDLGPTVAALTGGGFRDWEAAFRFFFAVASEEPTVVVLDEVPYLTQSTPGFASILQHAWDHRPRKSKLLLITSGSAISTMTKLFGPRGPLRNRPTVMLHMEPLSAAESRAFLPRMPAPRFFEAYAACGGYPLHLERWDARATTDENLRVLAGTAGGVLLDDAQSMLREELAATATHAQVLSAIGRGHTGHTQISSQVGGKRILYSLNLLEQAGFIRRAVPLGAPRGARPAYEIADAYVNFWYRVLAADVALIEAGQGAAVLQRRKGEWQKHLGWVFEEAARDHARRLVADGTLPKDLLIGRWWRHDRGLDLEVDVLGQRQHTTVLIGGAKWSAAPLPLRALTRLEQASVHVPSPARDLTYVLWSRGGVDPEILRRGAISYTPADMLRQTLAD